MKKLILVASLFIFSLGANANTGVYCDDEDLLLEDASCNLTTAVQGAEGDVCFKGNIAKAKLLLEAAIDDGYDDDELHYSGILINKSVDVIIVKFLSYGKYPQDNIISRCP